MLSSVFNQIPYTCRITRWTGDELYRGSGVFISPEHVLTAWHVLEDHIDSSVLIGKTAFRGWRSQIIKPPYNVAYDPKIDVAILRLGRAFATSYLRIADEFDPNDELNLAAPSYRGIKTSKGKYLKPNYMRKPDKNGVRYKSDFEYAARPRSGMSGAPVINSKREIVSLHLGKDTQVQRIRRFLPPIGNDMGPTPEKLFEFYERYRKGVEMCWTHTP